MKRAADEPAFAGITCQALDVRDAAAVAAFVGGLGELDAVVNCAGVIRRGAEHDPAAFAEVIDINLTGTMRVCAAASSTRRRCWGARRYLEHDWVAGVGSFVCEPPGEIHALVVDATVGAQ